MFIAYTYSESPRITMYLTWSFGVRCTVLSNILNLYLDGTCQTLLIGYHPSSWDDKHKLSHRPSIKVFMKASHQMLTLFNSSAIRRMSSQASSDQFLQLVAGTEENRFPQCYRTNLSAHDHPLSCAYVKTFSLVRRLFWVSSLALILKVY